MSITKNCANTLFSIDDEDNCNSLNFNDRHRELNNFVLVLHTDLHREQTKSASNESLDLAQAFASLCAWELDVSFCCVR